MKVWWSALLINVNSALAVGRLFESMVHNEDLTPLLWPKDRLEEVSL